MESVNKIIFFLILSLNYEINLAEDNLVTAFENSLSLKLSEYANYLVNLLEDFNDNHIGNTEIGRMLGYNVLKSKFGATAREGKHMKKMSMALMPLVFQVGATSTWMILTSIMAVKSVAIGMVLLIFKIAVSSAKVASFFTSLKSKHGDHHHEYSWAPHFDHHGHKRSLSNIGPYSSSDWDSYTPEGYVASPPVYKTIPTYKNDADHRSSHIEEAEYTEDSKKIPIVHS